MSWKKHLRVIKQSSAMPDANDTGSHGAISKYSSYLPEVYAGHPNRIQRYYQYDDMDRDSDIAAALDTIADFCTQSEEQSETPFKIIYNGDPNSTEVSILENYLAIWTRKNKFKSKLWYIVRNTAKYGDSFYTVDPTTKTWDWLDQFTVEMVKIDEDTREAEEYVIRGLTEQEIEKFEGEPYDPSQYRNNNGVAPSTAGRAPQSAQGGSQSFQLNGTFKDARAVRMQTPGAQALTTVNADNIVHLSLSVGMDVHWPFGQSILDPIFKTYKQKELLEDAMIIYRVQRAPERRIFYIDTGIMQGARAKAHIESIKNEIHQRRIPNRNGGGQSMIDASYNPLSILDDYFFAVSPEGRGSRVETLPGGDGISDISDLDYFSKKMARGLRIPTSYLSLGDDEGGGGAYNDGKLGAALIQEFRFNKYCMRLQSLLSPAFDNEFKVYLEANGVTIDDTLYELQFHPPQNFTKYRQIEIDQAQVGVYQMVENNKFLSERFKMERFLNLDEADIVRNEDLWKIEQADKLKKKTGSEPDMENPDDLSSVGLRGSDSMDNLGDLGDMDLSNDDAPADGPDASPDAGGGGPAPTPNAAPAGGPAPAPPTPTT